MTQASILIIDDEKALREGLGMFLEDLDYDIILAENGRVGLEKFEAHRPDLVLVDLRMPEIDGLKVLNHLSQKSPETPLIVVSGTGVIADAVEALRSGAWDYLLKPIEDLTILAHTIDNSLEKARLRQENQRYQEHLEQLVVARTEQLYQANQELKTAYDATLLGWSRALELREQETAGHCQRVVSLTLMMAERVGIHPDQHIHLQRGALLHDIGKMGIPDEILLKPAALTPDEWEIMKMHPVYAYQLLKDIPFLAPALDIPYRHHEHWDGSGYPGELRGEEIPLAARIFALVDVFDALTAERPYRPARSVEYAFDYIRQQAGQYFDPDLVEPFCTIVENLASQGKNTNYFTGSST